VRDLLLDKRPKDFDVATSARPEDVRELFRNSRIIGRRFRLVHVLFQGGKVIEVATFRKNPKERSTATRRELLIRSDNVFGTAHEDAVRRDFTMNALFYDLEAREILDWVGGMDDLERSVVHTIGEPETRFREDPVRILRALKFAGRLGLGMTPDVYDAIVFCREALRSAAARASPRRSSAAPRWARPAAPSTSPGRRACSTCSCRSSPRCSTTTAWKTGPRAAAGDARVHRRAHPEEGPLDDTVLWTLLLLEPLKEACDGNRDRAAAVADFLEPLIERLAISRRFADGMRRIISVLPRLARAARAASRAPSSSSSPSRWPRPSSSPRTSRPSTSIACARTPSLPPVKGTASLASAAERAFHRLLRDSRRRSEALDVHPVRLALPP
jgi:poly(A) polymerase